ncbi:unnamed protein product [Gadus morhua 'NCC']
MLRVGLSEEDGRGGLDHADMVPTDERLRALTHRRGDPNDSWTWDRTSDWLRKPIPQTTLRLRDTLTWVRPQPERIPPLPGHAHSALRDDAVSPTTPSRSPSIPKYKHIQRGQHIDSCIPRPLALAPPTSTQHSSHASQESRQQAAPVALARRKPASKTIAVPANPIQTSASKPSAVNR